MNVYATIEFPADRSVAVDLTEDGWRVRQFDDPALGRLLDRVADMNAFSPADGDPISCAAAAAAEAMGGTVAFVREPEPVPDDAVF